MSEQNQDDKVVDLTGHHMDLDDDLFESEATEVDLTNTRLRHVPTKQLFRVTGLQVLLSCIFNYELQRSDYFRNFNFN